MSSEKLALPHLQPKKHALTEHFKQMGLMNLSLELVLYPCQGYPESDQRYHLSELPDIIDIPEGPWDTKEAFPTPEETLENQGMGLPLDSYGRPLNPWLADIVLDPYLGASAGKGELWNWGINWAADGINKVKYLDVDYVLLGTRKCGAEAVVGGFIDLDDMPEQPVGELTPIETAGIIAAGRETGEEATFVPPCPATPSVLYTGPVADVRNTAHAWIQSVVVLFDYGIQPALPEITANDDMQKVRWAPLEEARELRLYGSHNEIIELASQN